MKLEKAEKSLLFSTTQIPDVFFTEYLSMANGNFVKVYLYMLFLSKYNETIKINDLSKTLAIDFKIIQEALKFWEELEVITKKPTGYILNNLQEIELHKLYSPRLNISPEQAEKNEKNKNRAKAIETINNSFFQGIMSPTWYTNINMWFDKYQFDEQVMITLFHYCYEKSALHKNYVQVVASAWAENNIRTYTELEQYFERQEKLSVIQKSISKKLGITRALSEYEKAYVEKWVVNYNFNFPIIELALKETTSKTNPNFNYINQLLSDWYDKNLKTPNDVVDYLNNLKQKKKNIKELEKKTKLANYEQRKYNNLDSLYANKKNNT